MTSLKNWIQRQWYIAELGTLPIHRSWPERMPHCCVVIVAFRFHLLSSIIKIQVYYKSKRRLLYLRAWLIFGFAYQIFGIELMPDRPSEDSQRSKLGVGKRGQMRRVESPQVLLKNSLFENRRNGFYLDGMIVMLNGFSWMLLKNFCPFVGRLYLCKWAATLRST